VNRFFFVCFYEFLQLLRVDTLISSSCLEGIPDVLVRNLGQVAVEGKEEATKVLEVLEDPMELRLAGFRFVLGFAPFFERKTGLVDLAQRVEEKLESKDALSQAINFWVSGNSTRSEQIVLDLIGKYPLDLTLPVMLAQIKQERRKGSLAFSKSDQTAE
jgi:hypothetical protein